MERPDGADDLELGTFLDYVACKDAAVRDKEASAHKPGPTHFSE
jgi:hypothetical protein